MSDNKINIQTVVVAVVLSVILSVGISYFIVPSPQGPEGPQGSQGDIGPQGIQGLAGPQGLDGIIGPPGELGEQGPQGIQGEKGDMYDFSGEWQELYQWDYPGGIVTVTDSMTLEIESSLWRLRWYAISDQSDPGVLIRVYEGTRPDSIASLSAGSGYDGDLLYIFGKGTFTIKVDAENLDTLYIFVEQLVSRARDWKTYSDHGVYFEYPSIHDLTIRNETDEIGLIVSFEQNDEGGYNYFHVNWSSPETITSVDEALDSLMALLEPFYPTLSSSIRINSTVYAHDMKYQYFAAPDIEGFTMNGINAFWHCENSNRDFNVEYYSNQQDTLADFYHLIESFECHSPEN